MNRQSIEKIIQMLMTAFFQTLLIRLDSPDPLDEMHDIQDVGGGENHALGSILQCFADIADPGKRHRVIFPHCLQRLFDQGILTADDERFKGRMAFADPFFAK